MKGVDVVVGLHLMSICDTGTVVALPGPVLAAADMFEITVRGKGGHGALPHETIDPVTVASQLVGALQLVVARQTDPLESAVLSVTRIAGGTANNVIPETVELGGTVRTFRPELRATVRASMERICEQVTGAFGATADFRWIEGYAAVVNDAGIALLIQEEARHVVGDENVVEIAPIMGGEDFSSYLAKAPGVFVLVGSRNPAAGSDFPHHHPRFTVDEAALPIGVAVLVRSALALLERLPRA
jgi:amidohydrolase